MLIKQVRFILIIVFYCFCDLSYSQNYPVYNHFYQNPYLYNPAEAGTFLRSVIFFNHRQQWRGVDGAPVVSTLSFHTPFNRSNAAIGLNVSSFQRGLLSTTDAMISYNYAIPLQEEVFLKIGFSTGIISNSLDLSQVDNPDDPALSTFLNNNIQLAGNFGLKFQSDGLNLGLVLPRLLQPTFVNEANFNALEVGPFDEVLLMAYYKKKVEGYLKTKRKGRTKFTKKVDAKYAPLELHFLYRYSKIGANQFEALAKLNLGEQFWLGASYRQNYGVVGNVGFTYNGFALAYAYEPASKLVAGPLDGSHEVQLSLRFGKRVEPKVKKVKPQQVQPAKDKEPQHRARFQFYDDQNAAKDAFKDKGEKKYIVSVKSFKDFSAADAYKLNMKKRGLSAKIYFQESSQTFHVYFFDAIKLKDAKKEQKRISKNRRFRNAKVITL
ncbi:PorP/SprF family type IX secretion system membrane protein [Fulvivirgaceae bacterium BMA10]|uniref:PorP/SprF family type IX secretion system membrane protein n=1 Tax=Splendidivirga corallicola TaxID=3051826 RepID=A0ABT8KP41_9BACT|nr:PorP/SprF family type IX secretion system membrane protein [Fulvivirgaceae bacterium BMA10]